jgi:hypothetical protein
MIAATRLMKSLPTLQSLPSRHLDRLAAGTSVPVRSVSTARGTHDVLQADKDKSLELKQAGLRRVKPKDLSILDRDPQPYPICFDRKCCLHTGPLGLAAHLPRSANAPLASNTTA